MKRIIEKRMFNAVSETDMSKEAIRIVVEEAEDRERHHKKKLAEITPVPATAKDVSPAQESPMDYIANPSGGNWNAPWPRSWSTGYYAPGQPISPQQTEEQLPRIYQYTPGYNIIYIPRTGFGLMDFAQLRGIAEVSKEVRLCIELLKKEIRGFDWHITPKDPDQVGPTREMARTIEKWFNRPDGEHFFDQWINLIIEEVLVVDALPIHRIRSRDGKNLVFAEVISGDTIKPLIDIRGKLPQPPLPSYTQVLYGAPWVFLNQNQMYYERFNATARHPYGRSPIENAIYFVNMAIRRDVFNVGYFTSGNVPEGLIAAPKEWTKDQIAQFQTYWDALISGNPDIMRKLLIVPDPMTKVYEFRRPNFDAGWEEWLLRVVAWSFGISPAEFGIVASHGAADSGFTQGQANVQFRMGVGPIMKYLKTVFNRIIHYDMNAPYLFFEWVAQEPTPDKIAEANEAQIYLQNGVWSIDEVRARKGDKPLGIPHFIQVGGKPILLSDLMAGKLNMNPGGEGPTNIQGQVAPDGSVGIAPKGDVPIPPDLVQPDAKAKDNLIADGPAGSGGAVKAANIDFEKRLGASIKSTILRDIRNYRAKISKRARTNQTLFARFLNSSIPPTLLEMIELQLRKAKNADFANKVFDDATSIAKLLDEQQLGNGTASQAAEQIPVDGHSNVVEILEIGGEKAVWKPSTGESKKLNTWIGHQQWQGEVAAYVAAKIMGIEKFLPPTVEREINGVIGSLQSFIEGAEEGVKDLSGIDAEILEAIAVLDLVTGQQDRQKKNYMKLGSMAWAIDNALCYSALHDVTSKRYWGSSLFSAVVAGHSISPWAHKCFETYLAVMHKQTAEATYLAELLPQMSIAFSMTRARALFNSTTYPTIVLQNLR